MISRVLLNISSVEFVIIQLNAQPNQLFRLILDKDHFKIFCIFYSIRDDNYLID